MTHMKFYVLAELDISVLEDIIAKYLTAGEPELLSCRLFRSFRKGKQKACVTSNRSTVMAVSLMSAWEDKETAEERTWLKLVKALSHAGRNDLKNDVDRYLMKNGNNIIQSS